MDKDRKILLGLLKKLDAPFTPQINTERAQRKAVRYLKDKGVPKDLTAEEAELVTLLTGKKTEGAEKKTDPQPVKKKAKTASADKTPKEKKAKKEKGERKKQAPRPSNSAIYKSATAVLLKNKSISQADASAAVLAEYKKSSSRKLFKNTHWSVYCAVNRTACVLCEAGLLKWDAEKNIYIRTK